ncbi:MAG: hypothetical protein ACJAST_002243 [Halopseudomonas sp.]|jgi:hypothetical protein
MHWPGDALRDTSATNHGGRDPWIPACTGFFTHRAGLRAQDANNVAFPYTSVQWRDAHYRQTRIRGL